MDRAQVANSGHTSGHTAQKRLGEYSSYDANYLIYCG